MERELYAVYDKATKSYGPPMCFSTEAEARRSMLLHLRMEKDSNLSVFPDQYELRFVGTFNMETAALGEPTGIRHILLSTLLLNES